MVKNLKSTLNLFVGNVKYCLCNLTKIYKSKQNLHPNFLACDVTKYPNLSQPHHVYKSRLPTFITFPQSRN